MKKRFSEFFAITAMVLIGVFGLFLLGCAINGIYNSAWHFSRVLVKYDKETNKIMSRRFVVEYEFMTLDNKSDDHFLRVYALYSDATNPIKFPNHRRQLLKGYICRVRGNTLYKQTQEGDIIPMEIVNDNLIRQDELYLSKGPASETHGGKYALNDCLVVPLKSELGRKEYSIFQLGLFLSKKKIRLGNKEIQAYIKGMNLQKKVGIVVAVGESEEVGPRFGEESRILIRTEYNGKIEYETFWSYGGDSMIAGTPDIGDVVVSWRSGPYYGWVRFLVPINKDDVIEELSKNRPENLGKMVEEIKSLPNFTSVWDQNEL